MLLVRRCVLGLFPLQLDFTLQFISSELSDPERQVNLHFC